MHLSRRELLAALGPLVACSGRHPTGPPPDILLVTFCSLRADRVGAFGYTTRATTPRLDAFAARGRALHTRLGECDLDQRRARQHPHR